MERSWARVPTAQADIHSLYSVWAKALNRQSFVSLLCYMGRVVRNLFRAVWWEINELLWVKCPIEYCSGWTNQFFFLIHMCYMFNSFEFLKFLLKRLGKYYRLNCVKWLIFDHFSLLMDLPIITILVRKLQNLVVDLSPRIILFSQEACHQKCSN